MIIKFHPEISIPLIDVTVNQEGLVLGINQDVLYKVLPSPSAGLKVLTIQIGIKRSSYNFCSVYP